MARILIKEEYEIRRNEILDAAQRLVYTKGYEKMSIQDILSELKISKGAFYHYFDSKQSLIEALIMRLGKQMEELLAPIAHDINLPALKKLQRFFEVAARWKTDRKDYLLTLVKVWYADENTYFRQKVQAALIPLTSYLLSDVINQGIQEGVFHTSFPEHVSEIIFSLLQSFGDNLIKLIIHRKLDSETLDRLDNLSASYQDAMERILGAAHDTLPLLDTKILREWFPPS
jgi:AcrR family transcriptional regulator